MKKRISLSLLFLFVNIVTLFADPGGTGDPGDGSGPGLGACGGADPDTSNCPLDNWVIILVACALVFAVLHLYRKQKAQRIA
jgi:hypothetical protein